MLAVMHRRKKNPRSGKSSFLGDRLAALQCPLLAKPNIAPAGKGEILENVQFNSSIKSKEEKKQAG